MEMNMLEWAKIVQNWKEVLRKSIVIVLLFTFMGVMLGGNAYSKHEALVQDKKESSVTIEDENVYVLGQEEFEVFSKDVVTEMYRNKNYFQNSVLMHLNPYSICVYKMYFIVDIDNTINNSVDVQSIVDAYNMLVYSEECYEYICKNTNWNLEKKYLDELIIYNELEEKPSSKIISIDIMGESEEQTRQIGEALIQYLTEQIIQIQQLVCSHEFDIMRQESTIMANPDLVDEQHAARMKCVYYFDRGTAESIQNTFRLITNFNSSNTIVIDKSLFEFLVEYGSLGFLFGLLVTVLYVLGRSMKDKRIYDYQGYCENKGIRYLDAKKYKSVETILFLFDLKALLGFEKVKNVSIVSLFEFDIPSAWKLFLKEMDIENKNVVAGIEDERILEELNCSPNILFVCKYGKTTYEEIDYFMKRLNSKNHTCNIVVM